MPLAQIKPTTTLGKVMRNVGYLVAHTEAFKSLVGASTNLEAEERVHEFSVSDVVNEAGEMLYPRPRAIIIPGDFATTFLGPGSPSRRGGPMLSIEAPVPDDYLQDYEQHNYQIIDEWFTEKICSIIHQMEDLRETPRNTAETYFVFQDLQIEEGPGEILEEQDQPFWACVMRFDWFGL